ncbi:MAG: signal peptidase I, partial [Clostridia bacterium]|nr:signal peptidase I [Clostridia bacterium]
ELKAEKAAQKAAMKQRRRKRRAKQIRGFFIRLVLLAVVVYVLFYQIVGVTVMPSEDMYPRIDSGDVVLFYRLDRDVRAQDVIVFTKDAGLIQTTTAFFEEAGEAAPAEEEPEETQKGFWASVGGFFHNAALKLGIIREENEQLFICRVVAVAGDTVEITEGGSLVVNGNHVVESNIFSQTTVYEGFTEYPLTLKAGECFVLADKRNGGADSRFFGAVYTEDILGTVITIVRRNSL